MKTERGSLTFLHLCLLALCAGIFLMDTAVSEAMSPPSMYFLYGAVIALFLFSALAIYLQQHVARYTLILLCFVLGAWRLASVTVVPAYDVAAYIGQDVQVEGTLIEAPRTRVRAEGISHRYTVEVEEIVQYGERKRAAGCLYISTFQQPNQEEVALPEIGDRVRARGEIKKITSYKNPGQVDFAAQAALHGIRGRLSARHGIEATRADAHPFRRQMEHIRAFYRDIFSSFMGKEDAAAIFAMLFGGYDGVDPELIEAFAVTGLVHMLSVSGSHMTLLCVVVASVGRQLRLPLWLVTLIILFAIAIYAALSNFVPPAMRSALMGAISCIALVLERETDARRCLTIVAGGLLLWEPRSIFDVSFLLSFAATGGLLHIAPTFHRWMSRWHIPFFLSVSISVTLAAQLATLPIMAWYFGRLSVSAFFANILILPLVEMILIMALGAGALALLLPTAAGFVCVVTSLLLGIVYEGARALSHLPYSEVHMSALPPWLICIYYGLLSFLACSEEIQKAYWSKLRTYGRRLVVGGACVVFMWAIHTAFWHTEEMTVHFIDVGQGDAAVVITPRGRAFMIDAGGTRDGVFDVGVRVDVPYLRHHGVDRLDAIFLTHAHEDHAGGAGSVMSKIPTDGLITASEERMDYARSMQLPFSSPLLDQRRVARAGDVYVLDSVRIEVLYAPTETLAGGRATGNERSIVLRVSYGDVSFLFTGDLTGEQETEVLKRVHPKSTVLKVAHHGSKTSTTEAFLQATAPRYAIISVGENNTFGHPHPTVLRRLEERDIQVFRTDEQGAIQCMTDGQKLRIKTFR